MFGRILSHIFVTTFVMFGLTLCLSAQDLDDVTVTGKITDSNGLAVVGASITAMSVDTGENRTVVCDDEGRYTIIKLKPGNYKLKVTAKGFGIQDTPAITTISGQTLTQNFKLAPATVRAEQTITVTDDGGPPVDTTRT